MRKELYDIEVFKNFFCVGIRNYNTKELIFYEISEEKNDLDLIYKWFNEFDGFLISFNGIHYDNMNIKYLLKNYNKYKHWEWSNITLDLKYFSDKVIYGDSFDNEIKEIKYFKTNWTDIDLFLYWSKMLRISKKISLKSLGIQLGYHTVQELPFKHDSILTLEDLPKVRYYNYTHDLGILRLLCDKMNDQIVQRRDAIIKFGFGKECYSWDGVKLGLNILLKEYCLANNTTLNEIKDLRTPFPQEGILIKDLILPSIKFKPTEEKINITISKGKEIYNCNSFYTLYNHISNRKVFSTNELSYSVVSRGVKYDIKSGGLHSWHENDIVIPDLTKVLFRDKDVSSYYPTLGSEYEFVPKHLPGMGKLIKNLKTLRLRYKAEGNKKDAELYKLALNGGYYGNLNNEYSPMFDPLQLLSVTINGQLFLLMLCEWFEENDIIIDACNTDGVTVILTKDKENLFEELCSKWEKITLMELEAVDYTKVIRKNINNYIAVTTTGDIKRKGLFKFLDKEIPLGDSIDELVISKALDAYFNKDIKPKEFISNPDKYELHIYDYCKSNKIGKDFTVYHNGKIQQQLNRYYFSKKGAYLFKQKHGKGTMQHINVGNAVMLFNEYKELSWEDYNIDYNYYISATQKIIDELQNLNQLSLFD